MSGARLCLVCVRLKEQKTCGQCVAVVIESLQVFRMSFNSLPVLMLQAVQDEGYLFTLYA